MQAVANNPKFAKKVGVPTKVGKEFTKETEMKYEKGGKVKSNKDVKKRETEENKGFREKLIEKITPSFLKKQKEKKKAMDNIEKGMKKGGKVKKYEDGGNVARSPREKARMAEKMRAEMGRPKTLGDLARIQAKRDARGMLQKPQSRQTQRRGAAVKGEEAKAAGMKKGGAVKKGYHKMPDGTVMKDSAHKMKHGGMVGKCKRDGIAVRGKTKAGR